jgi:hypothetical protein
LISSYKDINKFTMFEFNRRSAGPYPKAMNRGAQAPTPNDNPKPGNAKPKGGDAQGDRGKPKGNGGKNPKAAAPPATTKVNENGYTGLCAKDLIVHYKIKPKNPMTPCDKNCDLLHVKNYTSEQNKKHVVSIAERYCKKYLVATTLTELRAAITADKKYP